MIITIIILIITGAFLAWGRFRADIVTMMALMTLTILNILTPYEAIAGFSNPVVLMLAGMFIVAGGVNQTGLAKKLSIHILRLGRKSELWLFIVVMILTAFLSSFMSNYGTVALLLPIIVSMTREANLNSRRFLMPMAFAASMGGMMTLIGAPPNLIVNEALIDANLKGLDFFTVLPVGVILLVIGIVFLWFRSSYLVENDRSKKSAERQTKSPEELIKEYQLSDNLFRLKIPKESPILYIPLKELNITNRYSVTIVEVRNYQNPTDKILKSVSQYFANADTVLKPDDWIYVEGAFDNVKTFAEENNLSFVDTKQSENKIMSFDTDIKFGEIGVAEAVVLSSSKLINRQVKETGFRRRYQINILGIKREGEYILNQVQHEKIHAGDSLLIQGAWANMDEMAAEETDLVIVGQPAQEANKVVLEHKAGIAALILFGMIISMAFNILPNVTSILVAALLMIITGCFRNVETAYNFIRWQNVVFFAAMLPMATAMNKTGASATISQGLVDLMGSLGPHAVLAALYITTALFTMFVSNTATVIVFAPIAIQSAIAMNASPYPFVLAVATAGVMCLASPYATPPNGLVLSPGRYTYSDFIQVGLPLQILYVIIMIFALPLLYPF
ncbi:MAG TPA: SLC13 family permease [Bacteroidales bacterium]|nr:SLC13 family permease [Bacteroidales bacterium]